MSTLDDHLGPLARRFVSDGWCRVPALGVPSELLEKAHTEVEGLDEHMHPGRVTQDSTSTQYNMRLDRILWLKDGALEDHPALQEVARLLAAFVHRFVGELGQMGLQMRLTGQEAPMLSTYDEGSFFRRHVDATVGKTEARVLTAVYYFNADWHPDLGGALRVHAAAGGGFEDLWPKADSLVLFRAASVEHEVREARAKRRALTLWFTGACGGEIWRVVCATRVTLRARPRPTGKAIGSIGPDDMVVASGEQEGGWLRVSGMPGGAVLPDEAWVLVGDTSDCGVGIVLERTGKHFEIIA